jgi:hypothetical protein
MVEIEFQKKKIVETVKQELEEQLGTEVYEQFVKVVDYESLASKIWLNVIAHILTEVEEEKITLQNRISELEEEIEELELELEE